MSVSKRKAKLMFIAALALSPLACAPSPAAPSAPCPAERVIEGQCAGVACEGEPWTGGVQCADVLEVASSADLAQISASAPSGACIALAPGTYPEVSLPGGVSLLGRGAGFVTVRGVVIGAGTGTVVRGLI